MADFRIGPFNFVSMTGPPPRPRNTADREGRPGINGEALWYTGLRGESWTTETFVDVPTLLGAWQLFARYEQSVFNGLWPVVWAGIGADYLYTVDRVDLVQCCACLMGLGGLNGTSQAVLRARWTITPWIPIEE